MFDILAYLEKFVLNALTGQVAPTNPDRVSRKLLLGLMAIFYVSTTGLIIAASYFTVSVQYNLPQTLFIMSGITAGFMFFNAILLFALSSYKKKKLREANKKLIDTVEQGIAILEDELSLPIMRNPKTSVFISALTGYMTGETLKNLNIANDSEILAEKIQGTYIKR